MKPLMPEEALLGFDAREMGLADRRKLGPAGGRPAQFLLRTELTDVLSADTMVWPSIFKSTVELDAGPDLPSPAWVGMNAPFWDDLQALYTAIPDGLRQERPYWIIAATWHTDIGFTEEQRHVPIYIGPHIAPTAPQQRDSTWEFLGFDICDPGISGLSNCGYGDDEHHRLSVEWGRYLNRYHLFESSERAFEFRALTNQRVSEHSPFFVIGLWLIDQVG